MKPNSIEEYLLVLAKLATIIELLSQEQDRFISAGVLDMHEEELAETIKWNCKKLMVSLGDQVRVAGERTQKPWEETLKDLKEVLNGREKIEGGNNQDLKGES